jgi:hypothetical protein
MAEDRASRPVGLEVATPGAPRAWDVTRARADLTLALTAFETLALHGLRHRCVAGSALQGKDP